ncbi:MAG: hypothetical protein C5B51_09065 [Terriglobia bacterium]|nr:MAG: hypothetical protein C5B51_09065 [Terriglobia bacterium]
MAKPIVTLTTDFGLSDHFVGVMKGVILGICPEARILDISHAVTPFGIAEGAYLIGQAYGYFPPGTIHVVVVDPGVGSARRPILVEAARQYFVAPDNGVLAVVYSREEHKVRALTNDRFFLKPVSRTFHGRDVFSPVAAHLAAGSPPRQFGETLREYSWPRFDQPRQEGRNSWTGGILHIDQFGNVITNFSSGEFSQLAERPFRMSVRSRNIRAWAENYAEGRPGKPFVIAGSSGYLEISLNQASAARFLGCTIHDPLRLKIS